MAANGQGNAGGDDRSKESVTQPVRLDAAEREAVIVELIITEYQGAVDKLATAADSGLLAKVDEARAQLANVEQRLEALRADGPDVEVNVEWLRERMLRALSDQLDGPIVMHPGDAQSMLAHANLYAGVLDRIGWPSPPPAPAEDDEDSSSTD